MTPDKYFGAIVDFGLEKGGEFSKKRKKLGAYVLYNEDLEAMPIDRDTTIYYTANEYRIWAFLNKLDALGFKYKPLNWETREELEEALQKKELPSFNVFWENIQFLVSKVESFRSVYIDVIKEYVVKEDTWHAVRDGDIDYIREGLLEHKGKFEKVRFSDEKDEKRCLEVIDQLEFLTSHARNLLEGFQSTDFKLFLSPKVKKLLDKSDLLALDERILQPLRAFLREKYSPEKSKRWVKLVEKVL